MRPLSDLVVLDLSIARAGPVAVRLLSDWGADVIRIEAPQQAGAQDVTGNRKGSDAQNLHRNKRGISLDLKTEQGYRLFLRLVEQADIVVENFRVDVKRRLKIDFETLQKVNSKLIYASISGFGQSGPYQNRPGVDQIVQGSSGLMSLTGRPEDQPMRVGIAISDTTAGMFLGQGILLAVLERHRTGIGQWVHTSLLESMLSKLDFQAARYTMSGEVPGRAGNHHPTFAPMGVFEASDGWVNIAASTGKMFRAFCDALGLNELLSDTRFESAAARLEYREALSQIINERTRTLTSEVLVERLNAVGCPCGPIYSVEQAFEDQQARHLRMVQRAEHSELGSLQLIRSPINLSRHPLNEAFDRAAPEHGEHNHEIYQNLGLSLEEIASLERSGVI
ncbi:MAG: CaiB/BaiF CoA transferase family protein [Pseudomonadales bacterium]